MQDSHGGYRRPAGAGVWVSVPRCGRRPLSRNTELAVRLPLLVRGPSSLGSVLYQLPSLSGGTLG